MAATVDGSNDPDGLGSTEDRGRWRLSRREFGGALVALVALRVSACSGNVEVGEDNSTTEDDGAVEVDPGAEDPVEVDPEDPTE